MIVIPNIYEESLSSFLGRDSSSLRSSEWQRFRGQLPYVIPSEAGNPLSFRTETYGRVWGIFSFLLETVEIILSLGRRCFAIALHDIRLGWDSSVLYTSEWQANVIPNVCEESPAICLRFFISLRSIQNDRDVIPCEDSRPERNPGKQKLLPSYGRSFKGNRRKGA